MLPGWAWIDKRFHFIHREPKNVYTILVVCSILSEIFHSHRSLVLCCGRRVSLVDLNGAPVPWTSSLVITEPSRRLGRSFVLLKGCELDTDLFQDSDGLEQVRLVALCLLLLSAEFGTHLCVLLSQARLFLCQRLYLRIVLLQARSQSLHLVVLDV